MVLVAAIALCGCSSGSTKPDAGPPVGGSSGALGGGGSSVGGVGGQGDAGGAGGAVPVPLANVVSISPGYFVTCAALADGTARCWGDNGSGRLAVGVPDLRVNLARPVIGVVGATVVSAGDRHQCALLTAGTVACWGQALSGQLGDGVTPTTTVAGPVMVANLVDAATLSVGADFTCALRATGAVGCWGKNDMGQVGSAAPAGTATLTNVAGVSGALGVSAGWVHGCAIVEGTALSGGMVQCWGHNVGGVFGDEAPAGSPGPTNADGLPAPVTGLSTATAVAAGRGHSCALLADGTVTCWGLGIDGQLGDGRGTTSLVPVVVSGLTDKVTALSVGNDHACALLKAGTIQCWGKNESGEIGDGTTNDATVAVAVPGLAGVTAVAAGTSHTCAVLADRSAVCWGDNQYGELGDGTVTASLAPVVVKGP